MKQCRRWISCLLVCCVVISMLPVVAFAETTEIASGTCGENLTWTLDDAGTLTISGTGAMDDYDLGNSASPQIFPPWSRHSSKIKNITFGDGVKSIGDFAFADCICLTSVDFDNDISSIGLSAFEGCSGLKSIDLPFGISVLNNDLFNECTNLTSVSIPKSVKEIRSDVFRMCTSLEAIAIPDSVTTISFAFRYCSSLKSLNIPKSVTSLNTDFLRCDSLSGIWVDSDNEHYWNDEHGVLYNKDKTVLLRAPNAITGSYDIPDNVTAIGFEAFGECSKLENITIPNGIKTIEPLTFYNCSNLTTMTIPQGVTSIGGNAFLGCSKLQSIDLPNEIVSIGGGAFSDCTNLKHIDLPMELQIIADNVLRSSGLESIDIPSNVYSIEICAFAECYQLKNVKIPSSVISIHEDAFMRSNLDDIYYEGSIDKWEEINNRPAALRVHCECVDVDGHWISQELQANCTMDGYIFERCACGFERNKQITTVATGHTEAVDAAVAPTCTATGLTEGKHCSVCGEVLIAQEEVPALDCSFTEYTSNQDATCAADGTKTASCDHGCGATNVIPDEGSLNPDAHSFGDWVTEGNKSRRNCTLCGYTENKVSTEDGDVEIDIPEQPDLDVDVDPIEPTDEEYILVEEALDNETEGEQEILKVFDINLKNEDGVHVQPNGTVKVKLPLDWDKNGNYKVYRVNDDGTLTDMNAYRQGSHMVFETDHFSLYVIVEEAEHQHNYQAVVTAPTCTENGYTIYTCACGDTYTADEVPAQGHKYENSACTVCGAPDPNFNEAVIRLSGKNRYETSFQTADALKEILGVETFDNIVVAYGRNFADALAGSYLATELNAPILLTEDSVHGNVVSYIKENLSKGGKVYILGGTATISADFSDRLDNAGIRYERLSGKNRYLTNLEILKTAGLNSKTILVCTGTNFADSLSASAANLPILLVGNNLSADQKDYLSKLSGCSFCIIGGANSVSESIAEELRAYGTVDRISGKTREATSVLVAEAFCLDPDTVTLAYSRNYPDGLCGGPLAYQLGAPLLLVNSGAEALAADYVAENEIASGIVLGGTSSISQETASKVFGN